MDPFAERLSGRRRQRQTIRLFLCGDVMMGRGIDQVLPHPSDPHLYEDYVRSATEYVRLAEQVNGPIPRQVGPAYVWGAALDEWKRMAPDARIINLETSITHSEDHAPKGINYRMSPENAACLSAASIDCSALANNHILDWGRAGLADTLRTLASLQIRTAGAGKNLDEARAPAILPIAGKGRVLVFSFASVTSGTPEEWAATQGTAGVNLLSHLNEQTAMDVADYISSVRQPGDIVVVTIHWGPNWGNDIPEDHRFFARALIDIADVSIVQGHSSHHPMPIEIYRNRLILYGCGDFLNDYEGIAGYEEYRCDLTLMYFADIHPTSKDLVALELIPLQIRRFQLTRPSGRDVQWLRETLDRGSRKFETRIELGPDHTFSASWPVRTGSPALAARPAS
ncbi:MAG TPA: CapA family protein [Xanthobacteraceae bacterium]|nr:CapA family protein [Xanthobacteraceae bacterium]